MKQKRIGLFGALFILMLLMFSMPVMAAYPKFTSSNPLMGYGWKSVKYKIYEDADLKNKIDEISYRECMIEKLSGDAAQISYKANKGKMKTGWIAWKQMVYNPSYHTQPAYAIASFTIYKKPSITQKYMTVSQYSGGMVVSEKGDWIQVLFKTGGRYRLGWMTKSSFSVFIRLSMETTTQPLANGTYILTPVTRKGKALTFNAKENSFSVSTNSKKQSQKFVLQYVQNNYYLIKPLTEDEYLADKGRLETNASSNNMWKLTRNGSSFSLRAKKSKNALTFTAGKVEADAFEGDKSQQWLIAKVEQRPEKETSVVFSQYDPKWGGSVYYRGPTLRTISTSGCGLMALTNAVYALNGEFISPTMIADFSARRGHYFYNQGTADTLYRDFSNVYGKTYHFKHVGKTYSLGTVKEHLKKGNVAVALVPGHYIAIVAYREEDGMYLVLDSAIYGKRPTTIYGDWLSASTLGSGTMRCEYFHILTRR